MELKVFLAEGQVSKVFSGVSPHRLLGKDDNKIIRWIVLFPDRSNMMGYDFGKEVLQVEEYE